MEVHKLSDFTKYKYMRDAGANAQQVYMSAKTDGINPIACIRLLRELFQLSLVEAKEIIVAVDHQGIALEEYQEKLKPQIERLIDKNDV